MSDRPISQSSRPQSININEFFSKTTVAGPSRLGKLFEGRSVELSGGSKKQIDGGSYYDGVTVQSRALGTRELALTVKGQEKFKEILGELHTIMGNPAEAGDKKSLLSLVDQLKDLARTKDAEGKLSYDEAALLALSQMLRESFDSESNGASENHILTNLSSALYALALEGAASYQKELEGLRHNLKDLKASQHINAIVGPRAEGPLGQIDALLSKVGKLAEQLNNASSLSNTNNEIINQQNWGANIDEATRILGDAKAMLASQKSKIAHLAHQPPVVKAAIEKMEAKMHAMEECLKNAKHAFERTKSITTEYNKLFTEIAHLGQNIQHVGQGIQNLNANAVLALKELAKGNKSDLEKIDRLGKLQKEYTEASFYLSANVKNTKFALSDYIRSFDEVISDIQKNNQLGEVLKKDAFLSDLLAFASGVVGVVGAVGAVILGVASVVGMTGGLALIPFLGGALLSGGLGFKALKNAVEKIKIGALQKDEASESVANGLLSEIKDRLMQINNMDEAYSSDLQIKVEDKPDTIAHKLLSSYDTSKNEDLDEAVAYLKGLINAGNQDPDFKKPYSLPYEIAVHMMEQDPKAALKILARMEMKDLAAILSVRGDILVQSSIEGKAAQGIDSLVGMPRLAEQDGETFAAGILGQMLKMGGNAGRTHATLVLKGMQGPATYSSKGLYLDEPSKEGAAKAKVANILKKINDSQLTKAIDSEPFHVTLTKLVKSSPKDAAYQLVSGLQDANNKFDADMATQAMAGMQTKDVSHLLLGIMEDTRLSGVKLEVASALLTRFSKDNRVSDIVSHMLPEHVKAVGEMMLSLVDEAEGVLTQFTDTSRSRESLLNNPFLSVFRELKSKDAASILASMDDKSAVKVMECLRKGNQKYHEALESMSFSNKLLSPKQWFALNQPVSLGRLLGAMPLEKASALAFSLLNQAEGSEGPEAFFQSGYNKDVLAIFSGMNMGSMTKLLHYMIQNPPNGDTMANQERIGNLLVGMGAGQKDSKLGLFFEKMLANQNYDETARSMIEGFIRFEGGEAKDFKFKKVKDLTSDEKQRLGYEYHNEDFETNILSTEFDSNPEASLTKDRIVDAFSEMGIKKAARVIKAYKDSKVKTIVLACLREADPVQAAKIEVLMEATDNNVMPEGLKKKVLLALGLTGLGGVVAQGAAVGAVLGAAGKAGAAALGTGAAAGGVALGAPAAAVGGVSVAAGLGAAFAGGYTFAWLVDQIKAKVSGQVVAKGGKEEDYVDEAYKEILEGLKADEQSTIAVTNKANESFTVAPNSRAMHVVNQALDAYLAAPTKENRERVFSVMKKSEHLSDNQKAVFLQNAAVAFAGAAARHVWNHRDQYADFNTLTTPSEEADANKKVNSFLEAHAAFKNQVVQGLGGLFDAFGMGVQTEADTSSQARTNRLSAENRFNSAFMSFIGKFNDVHTQRIVNEFSELTDNQGDDNGINLFELDEDIELGDLPPIPEGQVLDE